MSTAGDHDHPEGDEGTTPVSAGLGSPMARAIPLTDSDDADGQV